LFDIFAPALERLLASRAEEAAAEGAESKAATTTALVVVVTGTKTQSALFMLKSIVQPEHGGSASVLGGVFDRIDFCEYTLPPAGLAKGSLLPLGVASCTIWDFCHCMSLVLLH